MIKSILKLTFATILAAVVVGMPLAVSAQPASPNAVPAAPAKPRAIPFHGKIGAVDKTAKTITLDEKTKRTFQVTSETKVTFNKKPGTLDDAAVGSTVSGSYYKNADGSMTLKTLHLNAAPAAK